MRWLELRIPPPIVALSFGLAMFGVARAAPKLTVALPAAVAIALSIFALGLMVALAGIFAFRRQRTTVNPMTPEATSSIVSSGIYRFTRNPMYVGLTLGLAAWAAYLSNAAAALGVVAFIAYINQFQIKPEERALLAKFGSEFAQYKARVRRWV